MTTTAAATKPKLPLWSTVSESYRLTFRNLPTLMRIAWPWLLVLVLVCGVIRWLAWPYRDPDTTKLHVISWTFDLLTLVVTVAIGALIAVPWHRFLLLSEDPGASSPMASRRSASYYFALGLVFVLPLEIPQLASFTTHYMTTGETSTDATNWIWWWLLLSVPTAYFNVKASLAFPALAVTQNDTPFAQAWWASDGNFWRLLLGAILSTGLAVLILGILGWILLSQLGENLSFNEEQATSASSDIIWMFVGMSYVTFLSLAYRHFFGPIEVEAAAATPP